MRVDSATRPERETCSGRSPFNLVTFLRYRSGSEGKQEGWKSPILKLCVEGPYVGSHLFISIPREDTDSLDGRSQTEGILGSSSSPTLSRVVKGTRVSSVVNDLRVVWGPGYGSEIYVRVQ